MRWIPLLSGLLVALLLAGCAHAPATPSGGTSAASGAVANQAAAPGHPHAAASVPVHFAGAPTTATASFDDQFPPNQWCALTCSGTDHLHDLTSQVPAQVPVHVHAAVSGAGDAYAYFSSAGGVSYSSYHVKTANGQVQLDADIVRPSDGTIGVAVMYVEPNLDGSVPSTNPALHTEVVVTSDPARVPPGQPVALALKPGDWVNATGEGVHGLSLIPPKGPAIHSNASPASLQVPAGAPAGTYVAIPEGTAAATLLAPNQTLVARHYTYHVGSPHAVAAGQPTAWDEAIPDTPVLVGVFIDCQQTAGQGCSATFRGNGDYKLAAPDGTQVFEYKEDSCSPEPCALTLVAGYFQWTEMDGFLDPHLAAGSFHATASVEQGNGVQATVAWLTIDP